jgi:hypothetical protein
MNNKVTLIRKLILNAKQHDCTKQQLTLWLSERVHHLHDAIKLPHEEAAGLLSQFVIRYIEQVPDFIEAIADMSLESGIYDGVAPLLNIASDYFLAPPEIVENQSPLEALLDEAYLVHRLLEEINDRFIGYCGIPLAPMDMTRANVVAHELIGEPFANELDQAVLFSAELLLDQYSFSGENFEHYIAMHKHRGWSVELQRWPCLTENLAIVLDFNNDPRGITH